MPDSRDAAASPAATDSLDSNGGAPAPVEGPVGAYATPEYKGLCRAVEAGSVSFHQVATAWFNWHFGGERCPECDGLGTVTDPPGGSFECRVCTKRCGQCRGTGTKRNEQAQAAYQEVFPDLLHVFGEQRGGVITAYFCENIRVGAALTDIWSAAGHADGRIPTLEQLREAEEEQATMRWSRRARQWLRQALSQNASNTAIHLEPTFGDPDSPRAKALLFRCLKVHYQALEFLKPKPRKICMRMTFNVITTLLGTLDNRIGRGEPASAFDKSHEDQRALEVEIENTEAYYLQSAMRTARLEYLAGMVPGLALAALGAYVLSLQEALPGQMAIAFLAGAVGALVSVMERLTSGKLSLNHEAGRATLRILGGMRPLIGAVFGLVLFVFIEGTVLPSVKTPTDAAADPYFFAAIAFLAGFTERFAQDIINPAKLRIGTQPAGSSTTAPR